MVDTIRLGAVEPSQLHLGESIIRSAYLGADQVWDASIDRGDLITAGGKGYMFNSGSSAYMRKTPSTTGDRRLWSFQLSMKRTQLGTNGAGSLGIFTGGNGTVDNHSRLYFNAADHILYNHQDNGIVNANIRPLQLFRDTGEWFNFLLVYDSNNAVETERVRMYYNGKRITQFAAATWPALGKASDINTANFPMNIGRRGDGGQYFTGYMADIHLLDGVAADVDTFGRKSADCNNWYVSKLGYAGSYGVNGFEFLNVSGSSAIATDTSGNGNDMNMPNGLSTLVDIPGQNATVFNPLDIKGLTGSTGTGAVSYGANGNRRLTWGTNSGDTGNSYGTLLLPSGKWYVEMLLDNYNGSGNLKAGFSPQPGGGTTLSTNFSAAAVYGFAIDIEAQLMWESVDGVFTGDPVAGTGGIDISSYYVLNFQGFTVFCRDSSASVGNGGRWQIRAATSQQTYPAPAGYNNVISDNLPIPLVPNPELQAVTYQYVGTGNTNSFTGLGFRPGFFMTKDLDVISDWALYDVTRGPQAELIPNLGTAEVEQAAGLLSFDDDGVTLGSRGEVNAVGDNFEALAVKMGAQLDVWVDPAPLIDPDWFDIGSGAYQKVAGSSNQRIASNITGVEGDVWELTWEVYDYVAGECGIWLDGATDGGSFSANGTYTSTVKADADYINVGLQSNNLGDLKVRNIALRKVGVQNLLGSILSSTSANNTAGCSCILYTGTGVAASIGHGMHVTPDIMIVKPLSEIGDWVVYHSARGATEFYTMNENNAGGILPGVWNDLDPTDEVFFVGDADRTNKLDVEYVCYCFSYERGVFAGGQYVGNGDVDGAFANSPDIGYFMFRKAVIGTNRWVDYTRERTVISVADERIVIDGSDAVLNNPGTSLDFVGIGTKNRGTSLNTNTDAAEYIWFGTVFKQQAFT